MKKTHASPHGFCNFQVRYAETGLKAKPLDQKAHDLKQVVEKEKSASWNEVWGAEAWLHFMPQL